ncbi:MAG: tetratricopeptide repeat protein [Phycisphaerales bacterium]|nr:tetratricopeptide repeat protein [Phycisphaerales bacterium]
MNRTTSTARTLSTKTVFHRAAMRFAAAGLSAGLLMTLVGCAGHGAYTNEARLANREKQAVLKADVQWQLAQQQYLAGDLEKARKSIENALEMNPKMVKGYVLNGRIMLELGNLELAANSFAEAEKIDDKDVDAKYFQGVVLERMSRFEQALAKFRAAMQLDPANPQYVIATSEMLITQKRYSEVNSLLNEKGASFAHNAGIRQIQGQVAMLEGRYAEAADALREARLLAPDDLNIQEDLARAQLSAGRFPDAELTLAALMNAKGNENRRDLRAMHARCLMQMERLGEARTAFIALTNEEEGKNDLQAWFDLGQICVKMNDPQRVRLASGRLISLAPDRAEGYLLKSMFHRMSQQWPQALEAAQTACRLDPTDPTAFALRALIHQQLGNTEQARADISQANSLQQARSTGTQPAITQPSIPAQPTTATVPTE